MPRYDIRYLHQAEEPPPTLGVREPRRPKPTPQASGTTAPLHFTPEPEAEAVATSARLTKGDTP